MVSEHPHNVPGEPGHAARAEPDMQEQFSPPLLVDGPPPLVSLGDRRVELVERFCGCDVRHLCPVGRCGWVTLRRSVSDVSDGLAWVGARGGQDPRGADLGSESPDERPRTSRHHERYRSWRTPSTPPNRTFPRWYVRRLTALPWKDNVTDDDRYTLRLAIDATSAAAVREVARTLVLDVPDLSGRVSITHEGGHERPETRSTVSDLAQMAAEAMRVVYELRVYLPEALTALALQRTVSTLDERIRQWRRDTGNTHLRVPIYGASGAVIHTVAVDEPPTEGGAGAFEQFGAYFPVDCSIASNEVRGRFRTSQLGLEVGAARWHLNRDVNRILIRRVAPVRGEAGIEDDGDFEVVGPGGASA